jgi:hypothetical protein
MNRDILPMSGVYHVVCHECPFEGLYDGATSADIERRTHVDEHGHRVSQLEITRPDSAAPI